MITMSAVGSETVAVFVSSFSSVRLFSWFFLILKFKPGSSRQLFIGTGILVYLCVKV